MLHLWSPRGLFENLISCGNRLPVPNGKALLFMAWPAGSIEPLFCSFVWKRSGQSAPRHVPVLVSAHPTCKCMCGPRGRDAAAAYEVQEYEYFHMPEQLKPSEGALRLQGGRCPPPGVDYRPVSWRGDFVLLLCPDLHQASCLLYITTICCSLWIARPSYSPIQG